MFKLCIALLVAVEIATAQGIDLGVMAGAGGFTASGPTVAAGQVGVEACVLCSGRFGIFGEYSQWFTTGATQGFNVSDVVRRADLGGGGLRIQARGRTRPFVDFGVVGGRDSHGNYGGGALGGGVVGGGVQIPFRGHWYIRTP